MTAACWFPPVFWTAVFLAGLAVVAWPPRRRQPPAPPASPHTLPYPERRIVCRRRIYDWAKDSEL